MIVVTVFLSILNQMKFHLVQNRKENCHHDHIPFNVRGNRNTDFSVYTERPHASAYMITNCKAHALIQRAHVHTNVYVHAQKTHAHVDITNYLLSNTKAKYYATQLIYIAIKSAEQEYRPPCNQGTLNSTPIMQDN